MLIDLPPAALQSPKKLADWIEVGTLFTETGEVSQALAGDLIHDSGNLGTDAADFFPEDEDGTLAEGFSEDDPVQDLVEQVWAELSAREILLGSKYPLRIEPDIATRRLPGWDDTPSFAFMSLIAHTHAVGYVRVKERVGGWAFRTLFEKVAEACAAGLFGGSTVRFGVPRNPGWPVPVVDRLKQLGKEMSLRVEDLEDKVEGTDGDLTLDIASRLALLDNGPGSVIFVIQCATGKNWRTKRGEPIPSMFDDLLRWEAQLVRAVAIPLWLADEREYARQHRWFDEALILDRARLMAGNPDEHLDPVARAAIIEWCEQQVAVFVTG